MNILKWIIHPFKIISKYARIIFTLITSKKTVLFDTSFIRGTSMDNIKIKYPPNHYKWIITETTFLELANPTYIDEQEEKEIRKSIFKQLQSKNFYYIMQPGCIMHHEWQSAINKTDKPKDFPLYNDQIHSATRNPTPEMLEKLKQRSGKQQKEINDEWDKIKIKNNNCVICSKDLIEKLEQMIKSDEPITIRDYDIQKVISKIGQNKFKIKCKSTCLTILASLFIDSLSREQDAIKKFTIQLDGENIKIDHNTISDLKISCSSLPYIKKFVTKDKGQAKILKFLSPEFKKKIDFIC